jgi:hypothetical protein
MLQLMLHCPHTAGAARLWESSWMGSEVLVCGASASQVLHKPQTQAPGGHAGEWGCM